MVVLLLVGLGVAVLVSALIPRNSETSLVPTATAAPSGSIYVHVLGAVLAPGLYELREGDRTVDAIAAAGGFAEGADETQLNLARVVADGEQLIVPVLGAVAAPGEQSGKINLNTATMEQLETLPRVGPALAQRILDWREANGRFSSIDDLTSVTGIGAKTFEGMRDLVTV